jgi:hypothetical protein
VRQHPACYTWRTTDLKFGIGMLELMHHSSATTSWWKDTSCHVSSCPVFVARICGGVLINHWYAAGAPFFWAPAVFLLSFILWRLGLREVGNSNVPARSPDRLFMVALTALIFLWEYTVKSAPPALLYKLPEVPSHSTNMCTMHAGIQERYCTHHGCASLWQFSCRRPGSRWTTGRGISQRRHW